MVIKRILHGQMTEKIAFEVRPKKGKKLQKSAFFKKHFLTTWPLGGSKKMYHMKVKSKISYLGEKISILPWQMAEQLAVEVDVKNVTDGTRNTEDGRQTSSFIWLGFRHFIYQYHPHHHHEEKHLHRLYHHCLLLHEMVQEDAEMEEMVEEQNRIVLTITIINMKSHI